MHVLKHLILTLCVILSGLGCDETNLLGAQDVLIYGFNAQTQEYNLHQSRLETLENARRIRGSAAKLRGGASLNVETLVLSGDLDFKTEAAARDFDLVRPAWMRGRGNRGISIVSGQPTPDRSDHSLGIRHLFSVRTFFPPAKWSPVQVVFFSKQKP